MTSVLIRRPSEESQMEMGRRQRLERGSHEPRGAGSRQEPGEQEGASRGLRKGRDPEGALTVDVRPPELRASRVCCSESPHLARLLWPPLVPGCSQLWLRRGRPSGPCGKEPSGWGSFQGTSVCSQKE